jgi:23S rRNA (uracil1939-C5)-methyltransferase
MLTSGSRVALDIEKPAVGGRMLARHHGQVVLVWGAIPGERVMARIERTGKGVAYAETTEVLSASPDRREVAGDWRCGGKVFAHVNYPRQLQLKGEIMRDALGRIGRVPLSAVPAVMESPDQGYRMRARIHADGGRLGFYREGTHHLCDARATGQLLPATNAWIASAQQTLERRGLAGLAAIELAEDVSGNMRACHLELYPGADESAFAALADGLTGLSARRTDRPDTVRIAGTPTITDTIRPRPGDMSTTLQLCRDVRAFFQGNRFLLERLVQHVVGLVPPGPIVDLYAGVGLFGLALAAAGAEAVTLVEGDPIGGVDLTRNAEPFGVRTRVERRGVEAYLADPRHRGPATIIVDPPRAGISKEAIGGIVQRSPRCIVYVSCDVATLARDARILIDAGYELVEVTGLDLFPNTAHVESVALFTR